MIRKKLTIGRLARIANIHVETIRFYQKLGLIQEPQKPDTGYRVYSEAAIARLRFIKKAKLTKLEPLAFDCRNSHPKIIKECLFLK